MVENKRLIAVRENSNLENKRGITLIALVVTIIVLLILAGVTVITLTGDNRYIIKDIKSQRNKFVQKSRRAGKDSTHKPKNGNN